MVSGEYKVNRVYAENIRNHQLAIIIWFRTEKLPTDACITSSKRKWDMFSNYIVHNKPQKS